MDPACNSGETHRGFLVRLSVVLIAFIRNQRAFMRVFHAKSAYVLYEIRVRFMQNPRTFYAIALRRNCLQFLRN